jgi:hypothetical protein
LIEADVLVEFRQRRNLVVLDELALRIDVLFLAAHAKRDSAFNRIDRGS